MNELFAANCSLLFIEGLNFEKYMYFEALSGVFLSFAELFAVSKNCKNVTKRRKFSAERID